MLCKFSVTETPALLDHVIDGTPFVPFAMLVNTLAQAVKLEHTESLRACKINMPVMLRKHRDKELNVVTSESEASLQDGTGNVYASLSKYKSCNALPKPVHTICDYNNLNQETNQIEPSQLYPDILFHGPTFQGAFIVYSIDKNQVMAKISKFEPNPISLGDLVSMQRIPIILTDLVLQVVGLHFLTMNKTYGLPISCDELHYDMCTESDAVLETEAFVFASCQPDGAYNISVESIHQSEILRCIGVKLQTINRLVQPGVLAKIETLLLNNDAAKKEEL